VDGSFRKKKTSGWIGKNGKETVFCFKPRPFEKGRQPVAFLGRPRGPVLSVDPPTRVRNAARGGSVGPPRSSDMDPRRGIRGPRRTRSTRRQRPDSPYIPGPWDGREPDAVRPLALRACTSLSGLPLKRYPRVVPSTPSSFHLTVLSPGPPVLLASPKSEPRTTTRTGAAGTRPVRTRLPLLAFATKGKGSPPIDYGEWPGCFSSSSLSGLRIVPLR
jgi:hypothetical protein